MINVQNALKVASKFLGNDKIQQAVELSKTVKSPQDAIKALSKLGDPNQILDTGINKLNNPMAGKMAAMFGADENMLRDLKNEFMSLKGQAPMVQTKKQTQNKSYDSRLQELLNGLK